MPYCYWPVATHNYTSKFPNQIRAGNFLYYMGSFVRVDANLRVASNCHSRYFGEGPIRSGHLTTMTNP
ncbi:hypothetical protein GBA52_018801 [Prunus armeniaca]|nr:hypothetical protein GBA52_018801 [Prunus armeniaca]